MARLAEGLEIVSRSATPIAHLLSVVELQHLVARTAAPATSSLLALDNRAERLLRSKTPLSLEPMQRSFSVLTQ
jgi:hypothetical protein